MIQAQIRAQIKASIAVKQALLADSTLLGQVQQLAEDCLSSLKEGGKIIFAGNGDSFADAQHLDRPERWQNSGNVRMHLNSIERNRSHSGVSYTDWPYCVRAG